MCRQVSARGIQRGQTYLGRRNWHLTVEKVETKPNQVVITAYNGFGEQKVEKYPINAVVELLEYSK